MTWKRSKDDGLDYDVSTDIRYQAVKDKLFGVRDDRPKASWLVVSPEIANELEPKLSIKERLKQRIKEGSLRT